MFSNLKYMMIKNDIDKMVSTYENDKELRPQIIERLFELDGKRELIEIASWDKYYRVAILDQIIERYVLNVEECIEILKWLHFSKTRNFFIDYVVNNMSFNELNKIINNTEIDNTILSKIKSLINVSNNKNINTENPEDESFFKIKMVLESLEAGSNENKEINSEPFFNIGLSIRENVDNFLEMRKTSDLEEEYIHIKNALENCFKFGSFDYELIFILINLSRLTFEQKKKLILELKIQLLYLPDFFQPLTFYTNFELKYFEDFFSLSTYKAWIENFLKTHIYSDYLNLIDNFEEFEWLNDYVPQKFKKLTELIRPKKEKYILTGKEGYTLANLESNKEILDKLKTTSIDLHRKILILLESESKDITLYLNAVLLIGGEFNYKFFSSILKRNVVDNFETAVDKINKNYLELKQKTDDPKELKTLVENEIKEKNDLIARKDYNIILYTFLNVILDSRSMGEESKNKIKRNLPNLERIVFFASNLEKVLICKLICYLNIKGYGELLVKLSNSKEKNIALFATMALVNTDYENYSNKLIEFTKSSNYVIKKSAATAIAILPIEKIKSTLLDLLNDENSEVIDAAFTTLNSYSMNDIIDIIKIISINSPSYAHINLVKFIGNLKNVELLPVLVSFFNSINSSLLYNVIEAISKIKHNASLEILKNINFKNNNTLEIKRVESLIRLGDQESWNILKNFLKINNSLIQFQAKYNMIKLVTSANIKEIEIFVSDPNPIISTAAVAKIFVYNQEEGWKYILRLLASYDTTEIYYLIHLLRFLDFTKTKHIYAKLQQINNYKIKTLIAICLDEHGVPIFLKRIENSIFKIKDSDIMDMLDVLIDYPYSNALFILEKIAKLQNIEMFSKIVTICEKIEFSKIENSFFKIWEISGEECKYMLAKVLTKVYNINLIKFIYKNIREVNTETQIELATALIVQGDNKGWDFLRKFLSVENLKIKSMAIAKIAGFNSISALTILEKQGLTPDVMVQEEIIKGIAKMTLVEAIPILERFVKSSSKKVRTAVAKALGNLYDRKSIYLLKILAMDNDDYVKVAAEIALTRLDSGPILSIPDVNEMFYNLLQQPKWKLSKKWFYREYQDMLIEYEDDKDIPLLEFSGKLIINGEQREKRIKEISEDLELSLVGCVDVDKIIAVKNKAKYEINRMMTFSELVKAILNLSGDLTKDEFNAIKKSMKIGHPDIIKAIIFSSGFSKDKKWLVFLEQILFDYCESEIIEILMYAIVKNKDSFSLYLLIYIINNEKARFYFIMIYNYLLINPIKVKQKDLDKIKSLINKREIEQNFKNVLNKLIVSLEENI